MARHRLYVSGYAVPIMLMLAAISVALSLYEAEWGPGLSMLPWLVIAAVAMALFLVRSILAPWVVHLSSFTVAFLFTTVLGSHYMFPKLPLLDAIQLLTYRLGLWLEAVSRGLATRDPLPFSFLLGISLWLAFHFSTWLIYRAGKAWWAMVAPAIALMANTYYSESASAGYVVVYAFCALLLIVRVSVESITEDWRTARIPHDRTVGEDFLIDAAYIVTVVIIVSWLLPPLSLQQKAADLWVRFERPWRDVQKRWSEVFPTTGQSTASSVTIYGDSLVLGGPVSLEPRPLFAVKMGENYRLQGMVYDLYDGRQWWSSSSSISLIDPSEFPTIEVFQERRFVEQGITVLEDTRSLVAVPSPKWFGIPVKSEHLAITVSDEFMQWDLYAATSRGLLKAGDSYPVLSAVSVAGKDKLREAGQYYPSWLPSVYFELPPAMPERIGKLAEEITAGFDNPYDKVEALEEYLRELQYSETVQAPPAGRDAVDYFLFDSQEGYCNYFASAMAVMARSLGIPARVVAGYAPGVYDAEREAFIVLGSLAHAWTQVYFPYYGWIDFEPTPSQQIITRADPVEAAPEPEPERESPPAGSDAFEDMLPEDDIIGNIGAGMPLDHAAQPSLPKWIVALVTGVVLLTGLLLAVWVLPRRSWSVAERLYANLIMVARLLGIRPLAYETPGEYGRRVASAIPEVESEVELMIEGFYNYRFGGARDQDAVDLAVAWKRVRAALSRAVPRRLLRSLVNSEA